MGTLVAFTNTFSSIEVEQQIVLFQGSLNKFIAQNLLFRATSSQVNHTIPRYILHSCPCVIIVLCSRTVLAYTQFPGSMLNVQITASYNSTEHVCFKILDQLMGSAKYSIST